MTDGRFADWDRVRPSIYLLTATNDAPHVVRTSTASHYD